MRRKSILDTQKQYIRIANGLERSLRQGRITPSQFQERLRTATRIQETYERNLNKAMGHPEGYSTVEGNRRQMSYRARATGSNG